MNIDGGRPRAWIDLASPSHPPFFRGLLEGMNGIATVVTARKKTETVSLAREQGFSFDVIGRDFDHEFARIFGVPLRTVLLGLKAPTCDISLSARNAMCVLASKANGIPSIHFTDNDITAFVDAPRVEDWFNRFRAMATYHVVPEAFRMEELTNWGADPDHVYTYDGFKEEVALASFTPDPEFTRKLPFEDYIVIRPEAQTAAYVDIDESLVPELLERSVNRGFNVVYLPRRPPDRAHARQFSSDRVYIPDDALDGLQLGWHSRCVLTGSGTMAREAACMQKPAVSFFPHTMLSVDQKLTSEGRIFRSRDAGDIVAYLESLDAGEVTPDLNRAREVRRQVVEIVSTLVTDAAGANTRGIESANGPEPARLTNHRS